MSDIPSSLQQHGVIGSWCASTAPTFVLLEGESEVCASLCRETKKKNFCMKVGEIESNPTQTWLMGKLLRIWELGEENKKVGKIEKKQDKYNSIEITIWRCILLSPPSQNFPVQCYYLPLCHKFMNMHALPKHWVVGDPPPPPLSTCHCIVWPPPLLNLSLCCISRCIFVTSSMHPCFHFAVPQQPLESLQASCITWDPHMIPFCLHMFPETSNQTNNNCLLNIKSSMYVLCICQFQMGFPHTNHASVCFGCVWFKSRWRSQGLPSWASQNITFEHATLDKSLVPPTYVISLPHPQFAIDNTPHWLLANLDGPTIHKLTLHKDCCLINIQESCLVWNDMFDKG